MAIRPLSTERTTIREHFKRSIEYLAANIEKMRPEVQARVNRILATFKNGEMPSGCEQGYIYGLERIIKSEILHAQKITRTNTPSSTDIVADAPKALRAKIKQMQQTIDTYKAKIERSHREVIAVRLENKNLKRAHFESIKQRRGNAMISIADDKSCAIDVWIDLKGARTRHTMTMAEMGRFLQVMKLYHESEWYSKMFEWLPTKRLKYFKHARGVIETVEKYHIKILERALLLTGGNRKEAARFLGIARPTLIQQLRKYNIDAKQPGEAEYNAPMCAQALNEIELALIDDETELMDETTRDNNIKRAENILIKLKAANKISRGNEKEGDSGYLRAG